MRHCGGQNQFDRGAKPAQQWIFFKIMTWPKADNVKCFSTIELIALLADPDWLDDAMKTIGQSWRRMNARRHGLKLETQSNEGAT